MPTGRPGAGPAVHLYLASGVADLAALAALDQVLDALERARSARFVFKADRENYRAAHVLLRHALSRHAPIAPAAWRFRPGAYGKPEIAAPVPLAGERLHFSLSHTRGLVCCAVAAAAVGVDAEGERPVSDALDLARRFFSPVEAATLAALPPPERARHFYVLWTLKESYVKALGLGLSAGLDHCVFRIAAGTPDSIVLTLHPPLDDGAADHWRFILLRIDDSYTLAAAVRSVTGARFCIHAISPVSRLPQLVLSACSAAAHYEGPIRAEVPYDVI